MRHRCLAVPLSAIVFWLIFFPVDTWAQQSPLPKTLLWRISGRGLSTPSYLYGTMHLQQKSLFQFTDSVYAAIRDTRTFALELHPDTLATAIFSEASMFSGAKGSTTNTRTRKKGRNKAGVDKDADPMPTIVDLYLYSIAYDQRKQIIGLESLADQMDTREDLDPNRVLGESSRDAAVLEKLKLLYVEGDITRLYEIINNQDSDKEKRQMESRNTQMAGRMAELMQKTSLFAAVGAAHLAGDMGLISLLRQQGFNVEPVFSPIRLAPGSYAFSRPVTWQDYTDPDGYFRISIPGIPLSFQYNDGGFRMHGTIDLSRIRFYFITSVPLTGGTVKNADSIMNILSKGYFNGRQFADLQQSPIADSSGIYGRELTMRDPDTQYWFRFRIMIIQGRLFMVGLGAEKKDALSDTSSTQFFASFKAIPQERFAEGYWFRDSLITLHFPRRPDQSPIASEDNTIRATQWGTADLETEAYYIMVRTDANPTFVIHNENQYFNSIMEGFEKNTQMTLYARRDTIVDGFPGRRFHARPADRKVFLDALLIKVGSRVYGMLATAADSTLSRKGMDNFLGSFRIRMGKAPNWSYQSSASGGFGSWAPAPWQVDSSESETGGKASFFSYDSLTSTTYQFMCDTLSDYTWSDTDTALLSMSIRDYISEEQRLVSRTYFRWGNIPSVELTTTCADSSMVKKMRMMVKGNVRYTLYAFFPSSWQNEFNQLQFFDRLQLPYQSDSLAVYHRSAQHLLGDLFHKDSSIAAKAFDALKNAPFDADDFTLVFHEALADRGHLPKRYPNPVPALMERAGELTITYPERQEAYIREISRAYRDSSIGIQASRFALLDVLAEMNTDASMHAVGLLMAESLPRAGDPFTFLYSLRDSALLTRHLYPALLTYSADSLLNLSIFGLHHHMLEQKAIDQDMVAQHQVSVDKGLARMIDHYRQSAAAEDWWWGFRAIQFLSALDDARWTPWLEKFLSLPAPELKEAAALALLRSGRTVPGQVWESIAAVDRLRLDLYRELDKLNKGNLFPKKYRSQEQFAVSALWESFEDETPAQIKYIGAEEMEFQGKKKRFYLYTVIFEDDGERSVYLGVSGPYGARDLLPEESYSGTHWSEAYTRGLEKKQLRSYLDEIIEAAAEGEKMPR